MTIPDHVQVRGERSPAFSDILTGDALAFVAKLERKFGQRRCELLQLRDRRQTEIDGGNMPDFLPETGHIRERDWTVAPIPADLQDRRVEITGPVDRKMVINALNSGANVYMADFEDSHAPTWAATIAGQINLRDAINGTITFHDPRRDKHYALNAETATLMVRPRGWHLEEKHVLVDGSPISAALFDFGLFFFHNAQALIDKGTGPYFYLPKLENHLEARLWNDAFNLAQDELGIPRGTIRATVLIENILASFEMDEILWELRDHSAGLNCGRWDYIFSVIRKFRNHPHFMMPDRAQVTMTTHMMRAYSLLTIQTCHRRGIHAIGGMAAQIPIKSDPERNRIAIEKVRVDKEREARDGHDGTWVAHPGLVQIAKDQFDQFMPSPHQIHVTRDDVTVTTQDMLTVPKGTITEAGLRTNIDVGILYMSAWLDGNGCVPIYNLMEDAATAEISRSQLWQWVNDDNAMLDDGRPINIDLYHEIAQQVLADIKERVGADNFEQGKYEQAAALFDQLITGAEFADFLTLSAYEHLQ